MKYLPLLCSVLISGCALTTNHSVVEPHPETLTGEWERKPGKDILLSIRFKPDLSCSTFQKNRYEGLVISCRYVRTGKKVMVFDVNPITGEDTGRVAEYEYEEAGEKLFSYRDNENEENSWVYLKKED